MRGGEVSEVTACGVMEGMPSKQQIDRRRQLAREGRGGAVRPGMEDCRASLVNLGQKDFWQDVCTMGYF